MKSTRKFFLLVVAILTTISSFGQGNAVIFNNEIISEEKFDGFELTSGYYTINNNISDTSSSVYVSDTPSVSQYLEFARNQASYFFIVHKGKEAIAMIILLQNNETEVAKLNYRIVDPDNGKITEVPCRVWGDISEMRADELLKLKIDPSAVIIDLPNNGRGLSYEGIAYRIQSYARLKAEVIALAKSLI